HDLAMAQVVVNNIERYYSNDDFKAIVFKEAIRALTALKNFNGLKL
ncbi:15007_t:CDS:1, partial [Racocetra persica]